MFQNMFHFVSFGVDVMFDKVFVTLGKMRFNVFIYFCDVFQHPFFPYPQTVMDKNPNLKQNPGW